MTGQIITELKSRWERLRSVMEEAGLDALISVPGSNFRYLTGLGVHASERLIGFVIEPHRLSMVYPKFEETRMAASLVYGECNQVVPWNETDDPYQLVSQLVSRSNRIALDPFMPFWQYQRFAKAFPETAWVDAGSYLEPLRLIKSPWETLQVKTACDLTAKAISSLLDGFRGQVTEAEIAHLNLMSAYRRLGAADGEALLQIDAGSADPHGQTEGTVTNPYVALVDSGANLNGYWADLTRTECYDPSRAPLFKEVYTVVWEAHEAAIAAVRPGATPALVDKAARDVIAAAGYGEFFTHRVGHGLGLDIHEPPYLVHGNESPLVPGMLFTIEPGIYLPGKFGVRIEDNVVVTETGVEILSPSPKKPDDI